MRLESEELKLAVLLAMLGFIFSTKFFVDWLNSIEPWLGLAQWYIFMGFILHFFLDMIGFQVKSFKIRSDALSILGLLLVLFAFGIVTNWIESPLADIYAGGTGENLPNALLASEDGVTWLFWSRTVGIIDIETVKILTYIVTPFMLSMLGGLLISGKKLNGLFR